VLLEALHAVSTRESISDKMISCTVNAKQVVMHYFRSIARLKDSAKNLVSAAT
jgi:hypothetical protein